MTLTTNSSLLRSFEPFDRLPENLGSLLDPLLEPCRFRLGQTVLRADVPPNGVLLIRRGQLRSLAQASHGSGLRTIERLSPGAVVGWAGVLRGLACEHLRATTEVEALLLPTPRFIELIEGHPSLAAAFQQRLSAAELHTILLACAAQQPWAQEQLENWPAPLTTCLVRSLLPGPETSLALPGGFSWFVSSGDGFDLAEPWPIPAPKLQPLATPSPWLRLIGMPIPESTNPTVTSQQQASASVTAEVLGDDE